MNELTSELNKLEQTVRPEPIRVTLPSGTEIDGKVQTDVLALVGRMVDEAKYGGMVRVRGADIATMVRNFQQSAEDRAKSCGLGGASLLLIDAFAEIDPQFDPIREAFKQFDDARTRASADGSATLRRATAGGRQSSNSHAGGSSCRGVPAPSCDAPEPPHSAA